MSEHPPASLKLATFDISGTTVHAADHVVEAYVRAFARHGHEITEAHVSPVRGMGKPEAIRRILSAIGAGDVGAQIRPVQLAFQELLGTLYEERGLRPVDGAVETFEWLRSHGVKVALTTGFDRPTLELVLRLVGWEHGVVDAATCAEDVPHGRPAPDMIHRVMMLTGVEGAAAVAVVGDTVSDLESGERAGAGWIVGVETGAHTRDQLEARRPTAVLRSVAELPSWWSAE